MIGPLDVAVDRLTLRITPGGAGVGLRRLAGRQRFDDVGARREAARDRRERLASVALLVGGGDPSFVTVVDCPASSVFAVVELLVVVVRCAAVTAVDACRAVGAVDDTTAEVAVLVVVVVVLGAGGSSRRWI